MIKVEVESVRPSTDVRRPADTPDLPNPTQLG